jgi:hypothetical protein
MDQSAEGKTILETDSEVLDIYIVIRLSLSAAPQEQTFLGRKTFLGEASDGESENDGPNKTEGQLDVSVNNVLSSNTDQLDVMILNELKGLVDVFGFLDTHSGVLVVFVNNLSRNGLEQENEVDTILQIFQEGFNLLSSLNKMRVDPVGERLSLDAFPLLSKFRFGGHFDSTIGR